MKTQNKLMLRWLSRSVLSTFVVTTLLLNSCSDDPEPANEEEVITTLTVTLMPVGGGTTVTMKFYDEDGDGPIDPVYTYTPATPAGTSAVLAANKAYTATLELLNETETPAGNITEEIEEEAEDHIFCFTVTSANLTVTNRNLDGNALPVGLTSTWTTTTANTGTVNIVLRHQPGVKDGNCPGPGDTDIDVTFNVAIQ
jgi:hypothetical protein